MEIGGKWWSLDRHNGIVARGNGRSWLEETDLCLLRHLTAEPPQIPCDGIVRSQEGPSMPGSGLLGSPIVKAEWRSAQQDLVSGFAAQGGPSGAQGFIQELGARMSGDADSLRPPSA